MKTDVKRHLVCICIKLNKKEKYISLDVRNVAFSVVNSVLKHTK